MSNISAGIGRGQMEVLDKHIGLRQEMNHFYKKLFQEIPSITLLEEPNSDFISNHWLSAVLVTPEKENKDRESLRLHLEKYNIESRPLWKPMHLQPVFKDSPYYGGSVAEMLFEKGLCLPSGSNLTTSDKERIKKAILDWSLT